ncbi:hypothetical protein F5Y13DRAFT_205990 [Hypoxylon sp. FL1857]|nr:hypothetical protein F5Y13DRAFT_205990 [Hypoxylon sp. FL1857]
MKPVTMNSVSGGLLEQDSLLLLNIGLLGLRYVKRLIARDNTSIRSKGGISLPSEIWVIILKFADNAKQREFCPAKAELVSASPNRMVLRCFRYAFSCDPDAILAGNLKDDVSVAEFEQYLARATPSTAKTLNIEVPELYRLSGRDNSFDIILDSTSTVTYLYADLDVPDIISTLDYGWCWVCKGRRFICPGCTGGKAQEFDSFMSCGVNLACPLCMGMNFSRHHKWFLENCVHGEPPYENEEEDMRERVEDRLHELGYTDRGVPKNAWKASSM